MQDKQVATFLETWGGFTGGILSSEKPKNCVQLSSILESNVSDRYFLSKKACSGILRRAEKRGKELPTALRHALQQVAGEPNESAKPEGRTV